MKLKLTWLMTLFMAFVMQVSQAQEKTVTGTVTSVQDGMPLAGVNVIVKGTSRGVQTDFDGKYSIQVNQGEVLSFTYVGMTSTEATVGSSNVLDVSMEEDVSALEEVVVVAYGTQTRESIVGSVATVSAETIEQVQATSVTSAIQGSVPGVNIITSGGVPGTNPTIRIRGVGSINASADPLIILDGSPYNGNLNTISQDQVESITVLKDASSTSLYGSRAANGVIVITTKSGRKNTPATLNVNTSYGFTTNAVDYHELLEAPEYMRYSWEALRNSNQYVSEQDPGTAAQNATDNLIPTLGYNPYDVSNPIGVNGQLAAGANLLWETDWLDELMRTSGSISDNSFNVSGGSEKTSYFFSANYLKQQGDVKTTVFERTTARLKVDSQVTDWLKLGLNSGYSISRQNAPTQSGSSFQSAVQWAYTVAPIYPVYRRDENGQIILDGLGNRIYDYGQNTDNQVVNGARPIFSGENGVGALYNYDVNNRRTQVNLAGFAEAKITDWLKFRTTLSFEDYLFDDYLYVSNEFGYAANVGGRVTQSRDISRTLNAVQALNFNKSFGSHNLSVDAIYESYQFDFDALSAQGVGFLPNVKVLDGSTTPESVGGSVSSERLTSYLGRASYNYADKYFIEGSYRRDSSTRFEDSVRDGDFYSIGGSWIVSREGFLDDSNFITYLKLKASYGELGNNRGIGYFPYLSVYNTGWNQLGNTGVLLGSAVDPFLTWEKTASQNYGVEFTLFDKLNFLVEYYDRESVDLIYDVPLPSSTGNDNITTNAGAIRNYGLEITLNANIVSTDDFSWSAGVNMSFDNNEITELTQESFINGTKRWEVGKSLYDWYIQDWAGVDPEDGYGMWYVDVLDDNGDVVDRETTKVYADATRYYQDDKTSLPDVIGGFNTNLRYRNFDFNAILNFSLGSYIYDGTYASLMGGFESAGRQGHVDLVNRWQQPGDVTDVPLFLASQNDFTATSNRFLFKNDYLRVKALNLGYTLDTDVSEKIGLSTFRIYLQGDNLFTFQSHDGIDPEQSLAGTTDSRSYIQKSLSLGLNLKF